MTIIERGKDRQYQGECRKCGTRYFYTKNDYFEIVEEKPSGLVREEYHWFRKAEKYREIQRYKYKCLRCPVCGDVKKKVEFESVFVEPVRWEKV